jgi:Protein of unknown function (DUF2723)
MGRKPKNSRSSGRALLARPTGASPHVLQPEPTQVDAASAWIASLATLVTLLALYVFTLAPTVVGGDSGELTAAAVTGGVPHPPGYPVFALLARLFAALPLGSSIAWRVNLLSAVATAAAASLLCATVQLWTRRAAAGLLAAGLFGTNPLVWHYATTAEVFGLNAMFGALALYLWLRIERAPTRRQVFALAFACGLGMGNHHTFVFIGAPVLLRSLWVARRELRASGMALAVLCGALGLVPYAYLAVASRSAAAVSWGDETTLDGLWGHFVRRDYGTFSLGKTSATGEVFLESGTFFQTLALMLGGSLRRLLGLGPLLAIGAYALAPRKRPDRAQSRMLLALLLGYVFLFCAMSNMSTAKLLYRTVLSRFFIQSDLLMALTAGIGWGWLVERLETRLASRAWVSRLSLACACLVFMSGAVVNASTSQRHNTVFRDFVAAAFASLPRDAIVITMGDHVTGAVFYFHEVEKLRPDVIHLDQQLLGFPWYCDRARRRHPDLVLPAGVYEPGGFTIKQLMDANSSRPLVVLDRLGNWDESWKDGYKLATTGLTQPLVPADRFPTFEQWAESDRRAMANYDPLPALLYPVGSWEEMLGELVLTQQAARANLALVYSSDAGNAEAPARLAVTLIEQVVRRAGGLPALGLPAEPGVASIEIHASILKNLGIGYEILSRIDPALTPRIAQAWEIFVAKAQANDPDLPAARAYLQRVHPSGPR